MSAFNLGPKGTHSMFVLWGAKNVMVNVPWAFWYALPASFGSSTVMVMSCCSPGCNTCSVGPAFVILAGAEPPNRAPSVLTTVEQRSGSVQAVNCPLLSAWSVNRARVVAPSSPPVRITNRRLDQTNRSPIPPG